MKQEAEFKVTWKPFFLNPTTPKEGIPLVDYISSRYGAEAGRKVAEGKSALFDVGKKLGITFTKDRRVVNTIKSHCMLEYARASEIQNKVAEALFRNYFEEGKDINSDDILMQIAKDTSLEETGLKKCLNDSNLQNAVTEEVKVANRRGIHGVPFFDIFIAGLNDQNPMSLSGAQGPDVFLSIFKRLLNMLKSKA